MFILSVDYLTGKKLEPLGLVKGNVVQSKNAIKDIGAGLKSIVGGELTAYTEMLSEARTIATNRMVEEAEKLGADGVVGVRFASAAVAQNAAEIIAFGTAVRVIEE